MKIGIIGTGNMGRILTEAFLDGGAVSPASMTITNRTVAKAKEIKETHQEITVVNNAREAAHCSSLIFICVKPHDVYNVVQDILPFLSEDKCVVSITSPISVQQLESIVPCSAARAIPSITNRALSGVSLLSFGEQCSEQWKGELNKLFESISTPVFIEEAITRVSSDIVSCGPAFFSYLTQRFINAAVAETEIDNETATKLAGEMLIGLGELLKKGFYTLPTLQEKVCVKGGITGEGIKILESELGSVFEHLFQATHSKFDEDLVEVKKQYSLH
ncbi:late competence protein ComER [Cytobacillus oceanisediminis]|uniref:late competence protein ComER n=1 Tax=Cytobacillus oceanisediminis TaxID=665099 RepID=UPI001D136A32|nr:late competence protein ComER [Cytobacillus oceanisediminis]MCC3647601.1 late competence protein ComER [Cytobacillus oceanisediminis]